MKLINMASKCIKIFAFVVEYITGNDFEMILVLSRNYSKCINTLQITLLFELLIKVCVSNWLSLSPFVCMLCRRERIDVTILCSHMDLDQCVQ